MSIIPATAEITESSVKDYFSLLKPRVMSLVVFTGLVGMLLAQSQTHNPLHPFIAFITILSIALGSGASGAINMWFDRDIDKIMNRTKKRPIPDGRINSDEALGFGIVMAVASVVLLTITANVMAGGLLLAAILFYVFIYTIWLKRRTPQNIVIGGAAGAFPPMIGWAAVTGDVTLFPVILFMIIFIWTPPHFWALSLLIKDDYKNARVPMLPVTSGVGITKTKILIYTLIMSVITVTPYLMGFSGKFYFYTALALNAVFIFLAAKIQSDKTKVSARRTFLFSIFYLFALFSSLVIDAL